MLKRIATILLAGCALSAAEEPLSGPHRVVRLVS